MGLSRWNTLQLTPDQEKLKEAVLPSFVIASLFCTSIELLARVVKKRKTASGENGDFFIECAICYFHLTDSESHQLWELRNALSHQYILSKKTAVNFIGKSIVQKTPNGDWIFYLRAMRERLLKAKQEIYNDVLQESPSEKEKTAKYMVNNGFIYIPLQETI